MSRAQFVRTAAATAIGFWAIDAVRQGKFGNYGWAHNTATTHPCDLEWDGRKGLETLKNLPGEFIFDVQSHHVDPDGEWRAHEPGDPRVLRRRSGRSRRRRPATGPSIGPGGHVRGGGAGEADPIQNLSRKHYLKEIFLDSATSAAVLSVVPTSPDTRNPLPIEEAAETIDTRQPPGEVQARGHARVRDAEPRVERHDEHRAGDAATKPLYFDEEMQLMMERAEKYRDKLRGWKTYCAWGDVPNASGWTLDSDIGMALPRERRARSRSKYKEVPPTVASHKGFALPGFDQRGAAPRDVGIAAKANPGVNLIIYHSGYDTGDEQNAVPRRRARPTRARHTVDGLHQVAAREQLRRVALQEEGQGVRQRAERVGRARLGVARRHERPRPVPRTCSASSSTTSAPSASAGAPTASGTARRSRRSSRMRRFEFTERGKELYNLPYGLEGDVEDPTRKAPNPARTIRNGILGRNVAPAYRFDPDARRRAIGCDDGRRSSRTRATSRAPATPSARPIPLANNQIHGPRTRREAIKAIYSGEWSP